MRIAGIVRESLQDGFGCNLVVFTQGCPFGCFKCHNEHLWPIDGGEEMSVAKILKNVTALTTGVTVSGGEPTLQHEELRDLVATVKTFNLNVTLYTGMTLEEWEAWEHRALIEPYLDYLKVGRYVDSKRDINHGLKGSSNQRMFKYKVVNFKKVREEIAYGTCD